MTWRFLPEFAEFGSQFVVQKEAVSCPVTYGKFSFFRHKFESVQQCLSRHFGDENFISDIHGTFYLLGLVNLTSTEARHGKVFLAVERGA